MPTLYDRKINQTVRKGVYNAIGESLLEQQILTNATFFELAGLKFTAPMYKWLEPRMSNNSWRKDFDIFCQREINPLLNAACAGMSVILVVFEFLIGCFKSELIKIQRARKKIYR